MNSIRSNQTQPASPLNGLRRRLGHVVRWQAEPVRSEEARETREASARHPRLAVLPVRS
jgi:hypothetical protein